MNPNNVPDLSDVELEAIAAGKSNSEFAFKFDAFNTALSRRGGGGLARRSLPGRGGRVATNAANSGRDYA